MGFLSFLFGVNKHNADPIQQELTKLIIDVTEGRRRETELLSFVHRRGWSRSDQSNRLTHAASMVRVLRPDLYTSANEICRQIYVSL
jgi:hypothetical protein